MKNTLLIAFAIVAAAGIITWGFVMQSNKYLKNQAIQECLEVGREEYDFFESRSKKITYNEATYRFCLQEKGIQ